MSKKIFYILICGLLVAIIGVSCLFIASDKPKQEIDEDRAVSCSNKIHEINLVLITDTKYIGPTMTTMYSAIKNKCPSSIYNYYIIAENITNEDEKSLLRLKELAKDTVNIKIIPQGEPDLPYENMQRFLQYKVGMHKIYLPNILKDIDKVIYMDGDTLVLKDLTELYNIDVSDVYAAVAKDGIYYRFPDFMKEMGLEKRGYYFNSGVMLYNLSKQREDDIVNKLVEYIKTHTDFFGDQDVLNVVFGHALKLISYRYNCISTFFETDDLNFLETYFNEKLPKNSTEIYKNASIIHYAGDKPWWTTYRPLYLKDLWYKYYNELRNL